MKSIAWDEVEMLLFTLESAFAQVAGDTVPGTPASEAAEHGQTALDKLCMQLDLIAGCIDVEDDDGCDYEICCTFSEWDDLDENDEDEEDCEAPCYRSDHCCHDY